MGVVCTALDYFSKLLFSVLGARALAFMIRTLTLCLWTLASGPWAWGLELDLAVDSAGVTRAETWELAGPNRAGIAYD